MKKIIDKLIGARKYVTLHLKKTLGWLIALSVLGLVVVSSILVVWRIDERPRTDDAFFFAYTANIAPEVSGRIITINIHENQAVHAGDILFEIDPDPFQFKLNEATAQYKLAA